MMESSTKEKKRRGEMRSALIALAVCTAIILGGTIILIAQLQAGSVPIRGLYATTKLTVGSYSNTINCTGTIEPIDSSDVLAPSSGTISSVLVNEGDYVTQGDPLLVMQDGSSSVAAISGTVTNLKASAGMDSSALNDSPAMRIADMNVLVGIVEVPAASAEYIDIGDEVDAKASAGASYELSGTLVNLENEMRSDSHGASTRNATIMFDDVGDLQIGTAIDARIEIRDYGKVYYVSPSAVLERDGCSYVDVVYTNGTIERHQVTLLGTGNDGQKIIAGDALADGSTICADLSGQASS